MNAIVPAPQTARAPTQVEKFMGQVFTPADRIEVKKALPAHVPFDRFERNLSNALMTNPDLLQCNPREVFREIARIAGLGLMIDAYLGECYLIVGYGRNGKTPQIRIGYRGLNKLARQSGEVASIHACEVHANDDFEIIEGTERSITHRPDVFEIKGERGPVVGYYAVVKYKDGDTDFEPMSIREIERIRDATDAYKAFKAGKIKSTPWNDHFGEMAKKTVFRRLVKRVPQSPDLASAQRLEDRNDQIEGTAVDITAEAIAQDLPPAIEDQRGDEIEGQAVEVVEAPRQQQQAPQPQQRQAPAAPKAPTAPRQAPQAPTAGPKAPSAPTAPKSAPTAPAAPAAPAQLDMMGPGPQLGAGKPAAEPVVAQDGEPWEEHAVGYELRLDACESLDEYAEIVEVHGAIFEDAPESVQDRVTAYEGTTKARLTPNLTTNS